MLLFLLASAVVADKFQRCADPLTISPKEKVLIKVATSKEVAKPDFNWMNESIPGMNIGSKNGLGMDHVAHISKEPWWKEGTQFQILADDAKIQIFAKGLYLDSKIPHLRTFDRAHLSKPSISEDSYFVHKNHQLFHWKSNEVIQQDKYEEPYDRTLLKRGRTPSNEDESLQVCFMVVDFKYINDFHWSKKKLKFTLEAAAQTKLGNEVSEMIRVKGEDYFKRMLFDFALENRLSMNTSLAMGDITIEFIKSKAWAEQVKMHLSKLPKGAGESVVGPTAEEQIAKRNLPNQQKENEPKNIDQNSSAKPYTLCFLLLMSFLFKY